MARADRGFSRKLAGPVGFGLLLSVVLDTFATVPPATASENKILTVTKDALYGAAAGAVLSGVLTLVVKSGHRDEVFRWGIVLGTFAGFGYGVYEVTRPTDEFTLRFPGAPLPRPEALARIAGPPGRCLGRSRTDPVYRATAIHPALPGSGAVRRRLSW